MWNSLLDLGLEGLFRWGKELGFGFWVTHGGVAMVFLGATVDLHTLRRGVLTPPPCLICLAEVFVIGCVRIKRD